MTDPTEQEKPTAQILCVDDERNILSAIRRTLRSTGYEIHLAESGAEGLQILEQTPINLVISDMRMPEMDGAEFLKRVQDRWPNVGRILLTGFSDIESTIKAVNDGKISGYLGKPWDDNELRLKVESVLKMHFLEAERKRLIRLTHDQNKKLLAFNRSLEDKVKERTNELQQTADMLDSAYNELTSSYDAIVKVLSNVLVSRRRKIGHQSSLLSQLCQDFCASLTSDEFFNKQVYYAALLFEFGKLGMSDEICNQPFSTLSDNQKIELMQYPVIGEASLMSIPILADAAHIIRQHCEHFNGTGKPDGLAGENISKGARVLKIVKDYFFFQWGLIDPKTYTAVEARNCLLTSKGSLYDPELVDKFIPQAEKFEQQHAIVQEMCITSLELKSGMKLSRDCINSKRILLLSKGTVMNDYIIKKLIELETMHESAVKVYIEIKRH